MDQGEVGALVLEGVIQALEEEKIQLRTMLETETEATLRDQITERIAEIDDSLQAHSVESASEPD